VIPSLERIPTVTPLNDVESIPAWGDRPPDPRLRGLVQLLGEPAPAGCWQSPVRSLAAGFITGMALRDAPTVRAAGFVMRRGEISHRDPIGLGVAKALIAVDVQG
jgi:hypothetical protein